MQKILAAMISVINALRSVIPQVTSPDRGTDTGCELQGPKP